MYWEQHEIPLLPPKDRNDKLLSAFWLQLDLCDARTPTLTSTCKAGRKPRAGESPALRQIPARSPTGRSSSRAFAEPGEWRTGDIVWQTHPLVDLGIVVVVGLGQDPTGTQNIHRYAVLFYVFGDGLAEAFQGCLGSAIGRLSGTAFTTLRFQNSC